MLASPKHEKNMIEGKAEDNFSNGWCSQCLDVVAEPLKGIDHVQIEVCCIWQLALNLFERLVSLIQLSNG